MPARVGCVPVHASSALYPTDDRVCFLCGAGPDGTGGGRSPCMTLFRSLGNFLLKRKFQNFGIVAGRVTDNSDPWCLLTSSCLPPSPRLRGQGLQQGEERRQEGPPQAVRALRAGLVLLRRPPRDPPRRRGPLLPLHDQEDAGEGQVSQLHFSSIQPHLFYYFWLL